MRDRKIKYIIIFFLFLAALILGLVIFQGKNEKKLKVIFFDVGQGDAILVSQGSTQILVDGGRSGRIISEKLGEVIPFWDRKIEMVVATHPDQDHIGGLLEVLRNYQVDLIVETRAVSNSKTFEAWRGLVKEENAENIEAVKGLSMRLPGEATFEILYPFFPIENGASGKTNDSSIVAKVGYGGNSFLLTGDLPDYKEAELVSADIDLEANVLKVSHHGSKYSSSENFLKEISPKESVISVGKNKYGHPSREAILRLKEAGSEIIRTDESGDIVYLCESASEKCQIDFN